MNEPSLSREFTIAMHERAIESCDDIEQLRSVAKTLLRAWQMQASFTENYAAQLMHLTPPPFSPAAPGTAQ
jgi:hypothetical protein